MSLPVPCSPVIATSKRSPYIRKSTKSELPRIPAFGSGLRFALAGTLDIDLTNDPLGTDKDGKPVRLADIWPSDTEVQELLKRSIDSQMFRNSYAGVFQGDENWTSIQVPAGQRLCVGRLPSSLTSKIRPTSRA